MAKSKKTLNKSQKKTVQIAKAERQRKYQWVLINGKQVKIKRPELIEGSPIDEFIAINADPIWLHQNELWELNESSD